MRMKHHEDSFVCTIHTSKRIHPQIGLVQPPVNLPQVCFWHNLFTSVFSHFYAVCIRFVFCIRTWRKRKNKKQKKLELIKWSIKTFDCICFLWIVLNQWKYVPNVCVGNGRCETGLYWVETKMWLLTTSFLYQYYHNFFTQITRSTSIFHH